MEYQEFLSILRSYAEDQFALFQHKLIPTKQTIIGVRTPVLRKIAKTYQTNFEEIFSYPDTVYEVTFIKLAQVSTLPYEQFIHYVKDCVERIDNWATCDSFKAKCLRKNKDSFLPVLEELFINGSEFKVRYVLVTLLSYYIEERYLPLIEEYVFRADTASYYVHMAVAWLVAELLIKAYEFGVALLQTERLNSKTHNKAIQKAIESFRLNKQQKDFLRTLRK